MRPSKTVSRWLVLLIFVCCCEQTWAQGPILDTAAPPTLEQLKQQAAKQSRYFKADFQPVQESQPVADLKRFRNKIRPVLTGTCVDCHGADVQEGNIRIDSLDPNLLHGQDTDWWLEVFAVLSKEEMPPDPSDLDDQDRAMITEWLAAELRKASQVQKSDHTHSSFRRMTGYEMNYALQDLLGLPFQFTKDLPPESNSEDGFQNNSEHLHMTVLQLQTYRELARSALRRATVQGPQPQPIYWGVTMQAASGSAWAEQQAALEKIRKEHRDDPEDLKKQLEKQIQRFRSPPRQGHFKNLETGHTAEARWRYSGAKYAWAPSDTPIETPMPSNYVAILPPGQRLIVELGDRIPERGNLRVRVRASRSSKEGHIPSLQLEFGWQASNDSQASVRVSQHDYLVENLPDDPQFFEWLIPLSEIYPRNSVRGVNQLGDLPNPSEYIKFVNSSASGGEVQLDYVEVTAPVYEQWPPASHVAVLGGEKDLGEEPVRRELIDRFLSRAWRRPLTDAELDQKCALYHVLRPECPDDQTAVLEVLANGLASPKFIYLTRESDKNRDDELAARLALFLWCSVPDQELMDLAGAGKLRQPEVLSQQVERMLLDRRAERLSREFTRQWLGLQLLEYLQVDREAYRQFDANLREAMAEEPLAFFAELLRKNGSVLDLLHADFAMVNERLARHYRLPHVRGNAIRRVSLPPNSDRGGLLTQAGLLAMNSDGKDSHPLKRGVWVLERILNDPPPPPPPAVPQIDLSDPEIAKLTLKERIADHRNQAACRSCHLKIDPWGIAFENYDAIGAWRTEVEGQPVDSTSELYGHIELAGMDGLKRYLLAERQDQFVRALVAKLTTFAVGRPLTFADRAEIERITGELRRGGDGLKNLVQLIVASDLFQE